MLTSKHTYCICASYLFLAGRSQWPSGLKRGSAADLLLGLRVRIPPGNECLSLVSVVCCQIEVSATGRSLVQRSPADCVVSLCATEKPQDRGYPDSRLVVAPGKRKLFLEALSLGMHKICISYLWYGTAKSMMNVLHCVSVV